MPHGLPDFWQGTIAGMPTIGAGQVAWFQSEAHLVAAAGGHYDLVSYEVPDNMELHICSGVISCAFPCIQRYKLITTPATWVSPTSYIDPNNVWSHEERAYDNDLSSYASASVDPANWTPYLELLVNEQNIDKVRFYSIYFAGLVDKIWVDVWYLGGWNHVDDGAFADREWVTWDIPAGVSLVSKARVRFYNSGAHGDVAVLFEFMFNTSGETAQEGIYFDTHAIIPYLPQAPYIVPAKATFLVRVYNDEEAIHNMSVSLAGFLQSKV